MFPQVILDIERVELGIAAGLQDRVIQTYGGLVHMDFTQTAPPVDQVEAGGLSPYTCLNTALLPEMYLAYDAHAGNVKRRNTFCFACLILYILIVNL